MKQMKKKPEGGKQSTTEKTVKQLRKELNEREENLLDNKLVNDDDSNTGRGKYQSKQGDGKSAEPSTNGGETE